MLAQTTNKRQLLNIYRELLKAVKEFFPPTGVTGHTGHIPISIKNSRGRFMGDKEGDSKIIDASKSSVKLPSKKISRLIENITTSETEVKILFKKFQNYMVNYNMRRLECHQVKACSRN